MVEKKLRVGIIGCGNISSIYMKNLSMFGRVDIAACADTIPERARERAREFGVRCVEPDALLDDPEIDLVVNLTTPEAHADVGLRTLEAGKHLYNEKPLAIEMSDAEALLVEADTRGLRVGCAPDTVLGAGITRARELLDSGAVGRPVAGCAFFHCPGHESWHPDPDFYYKSGGGPLFDMGPYYLTALIALLGPVRRVTGSARRTRDTRIITSEPRRGESIHVEVPTHVAGVLDFVSGEVVSLIMTFDVQGARLPGIEIYGTEGSLSVPDPNTFGGPVALYRPETSSWSEETVLAGFSENSRGIGVADMASAIAGGKPHRAAGSVALHVLEIMHALHRASDASCHVELGTTCGRPDPLPSSWEP